MTRPFSHEIVCVVFNDPAAADGQCGTAVNNDLRDDE
jgi:hypothetical protein